METRVTRLLVQQAIPFRLLSHTEPVFTIEDAAKVRGLPASDMIKCLVFIPRKGPRVVVACIPGDRRLSMSKLKASTGVKELRSSQRAEIAEAIGYPVGAIPPIALPDDALVVAHVGLLEKNNVGISAGDPAFGLEVRINDLRKVLHCNFADLVE